MIKYPILIPELIDLYESGKIKEEGKIYPCYLTKEHNENNLLSWVHDFQFKGLLNLRIEKQKLIADLLWGKKNCCI